MSDETEEGMVGKTKIVDVVYEQSKVTFIGRLWLLLDRHCRHLCEGW